MNHTDKFSTKDLVSATFIAYNGVKFASEYDLPTKSWIFEDPEKCQELDFKLRNGESQVEVIKYESVRRTLLGMANVSRNNK
ncbi:MAG TPA: hypothetical protein P5136_00390 [Methanofastidiosum sp.]|nr:hypothetical protein [Methanofastidiosum sp.]